MSVAGPKGDFDPAIFVMTAGTALFRVFSGRSGRTATEFNPGIGPRTRFAFFPDAEGTTVPVLYAAATEEAALSESILHDIPATGGTLVPSQYRDKVMARITPRRDLTLASFMGMGLRQIRATHGEITSTSPAHYAATVHWAKAAHDVGCDGIVWMSPRCNTDHAVVLFGDRVSGHDLAQDPGFGRIFDLGPDLDWLSDTCAPLGIEVRC
ncbi:RES domain-containing protein [Arthrobacter livingstonensis]|uniref:RES domain-containing protein n=1 Tax=Arthrobacter livingstonensis TaxID=670078 RepID=A0A2V5L5S3_9MICC|nr:RES family NAD+ phosphorylase [Arthrobacter livingstonensis]PYI66548.1 RES domain-containing protein [Arthrobacter livingstonensis]